MQLHLSRFSLGFMFLFVIGVNPGVAQNLTATQLDSLLQRAVVATVEQEYDHAFRLVDQAIALAPNDPLGPLFRAATLQSRMMDYEIYDDEKEFFKSVKQCRQLAEKKLQRQPNDAWGHFALGSAYGYEAFYIGKKKRYLEAVHLGWNSIKHLEAAVRLDSTLYDAYLGIGTYKYYRSKLKLLFFSDERETGLAMVRKAGTHGKYSRYAALNGLTWILLDENNAQEAFAISDAVLLKHPRSRFFMWGVAESASRLEKIDYAREIYRRLINTLQEEGKLTPYLEAVGRTKLSRVEFRAGNAEAACRELTRAAELKIERDPRHKDVEKQIASLQASCPASPSTYSNGKSGQ